MRDAVVAIITVQRMGNKEAFESLDKNTRQRAALKALIVLGPRALAVFSDLFKKLKDYFVRS